MGPGTLQKNLKWLGLTALAGLVCGGVVFLLAPMIAKNIVFVAGLPFAGLLLIVMVINFQWMMLFLLGTRALLDPVLNLSRVGGGAGLGALLNLLVIAMVLVMCLRFRSEFEGRRFFWASWLLFLAAVTVPVFYSPIPKQGIRLIINFLTYACIFCAPLFLARDDRSEKFWYRWLLLSSVPVLLLADVGLLTRHPMLFGTSRLRGTFSHANILAFYLVYVLALILYIWKTQKIRLNGERRFFLVLHALNAMVLMVFTQTRSAWICCALLFFLYGVLRDRRLVVLCLILGGVLTLTPPVRERLADLTQGTGQRRSDKLNSMAWRMKLWEHSFVEIKKHWLTGQGLGSFEYLSPQFGGLHRDESAPAHNIYVELLFEAGVFGLIAFVSIFARIMKRLWIRMRARSPDGDGAAVVFVYLLGYLFVSFSDNTLYYLSMNWYLWFFTGLVLAGDPARRKAVAEEASA